MSAKPPPATPRVCLPEGVRPGPLTLRGGRARHLAAALRLRRGDEFLAFAGDGREYHARILGIARDSVEATVGELARQAPPPTRLVEVWCANVRATRMEWAIEKCVEAGADLFRPIATERGARGAGLSEARLERWRRIAVEASEQCGRLHLPAIAPMTPFAEAVEARGEAALLLASPRGAPWSEAAAHLPRRGVVAVAIGPEGGFSAREETAARATGAVTVSLGPYTLRTETAAVAAAAFLARA